MDTNSPRSGEIIRDTYVNIADLRMKKIEEGFEVIINTAYYVSEDSRFENAQSFFKRGRHLFIYDSNSTDDPLVQGYNYLKTLDEFTSANDV